jgi:uncharacterized protein (TIGR00297 family)
MPMTFAARVLTGVALGAVVAVAGYRAKSLTGSGAAAAAVVGVAAVAAGWSWAVVLIAYFGVSSLLSRLGARRKRSLLAGVVDKTGARDATQVMANGFPFLLCALIVVVRPTADPLLWMTCACASLAASAADTWATEIGTLVGHTPRSVLTWRPMTVGESGGVTIAGWLAALTGAAFVGLVAVLAGLSARAFPFILAGGFAGAALDSIAGASAQRRSWCDVCGQATEMRVHTCGTVTRHTGGLAWLENDGVNLLATATGALLPWIFRSLLANGGMP